MITIRVTGHRWIENVVRPVSEVPMRRYRLLLPFVLATTAVLAACLVAPDEPGSTANGLSCAAGQRAFNGACRQTCKSTSDCAGGLKCMHVGAGETLCLDYGSCAHLGSDTQCDRPGGHGYSSGYDPYGVPAPYGQPYDPYAVPAPYTPYSGGGGCLGNARWSVLPANRGVVECAQQHDVRRCQAVAGQCVLVDGTVSEIAEP